MAKHYISSGILALFSGLLVSASSAAVPRGGDVGLSPQEECPIRIDFQDEDAADYWKAVNDGVMGGRSSGGPRFADGFMIFEGNIVTDGGGFSSVRANMEIGALSEASGLLMRVRSDGRDYKVTLRSSTSYRGRAIAFQAPIPVTPEGEWAEVKIPFSDLEGSFFGRDIPDAKFDKNTAYNIGIILADNQDGPFRLDIQWIESC